MQISTLAQPTRCFFGMAARLRPRLRVSSIHTPFGAFTSCTRLNVLYIYSGLILSRAGGGRGWLRRCGGSCAENTSPFDADPPGPRCRLESPPSYSVLLSSSFLLLLRAGCPSLDLPPKASPPAHLSFWIRFPPGPTICGGTSAPAPIIGIAQPGPKQNNKPIPSRSAGHSASSDRDEDERPPLN